MVPNAEKNALPHASEGHRTLGLFSVTYCLQWSILGSSWNFSKFHEPLLVVLFVNHMSSVMTCVEMCGGVSNYLKIIINKRHTTLQL